MPEPAEPFLVVGLGASAGGIGVLKEFFRHVPATTGNAYVVILHLSPEHESLLSEILQTVARIPVAQVTERVRMEADHAYVIAPNKSLSVVDGHLTVSDVIGFEARRAPVDIFFRTLAEAKERAPCAWCCPARGRTDRWVSSASRSADFQVFATDLDDERSRWRARAVPRVADDESLWLWLLVPGLPRHTESRNAMPADARLNNAAEPS